MTMIADFVTEADKLLDEIWEVASGLGYSRCESDALILGSYFFYDAVQRQPEEAKSVREEYGHDLLPAPSEELLNLSSALCAYALATGCNGYGPPSIKMLLASRQLLDACHKGLDKSGFSTSITADHIREALSIAGKKGAAKANEDGARLKAEAFEFWKKEISPNISNEKAATVLSKQFPLQHRTLSRYVSEWKNTV